MLQRRQVKYESFVHSARSLVVGLLKLQHDKVSAHSVRSLVIDLLQHHKMSER